MELNTNEVVLKCLESKEFEATKSKDCKEQHCSTSSGSCPEKVHNGVFITLKIFSSRNSIYSYRQCLKLR